MRVASDIGGTTAKVSLVVGGNCRIFSDYWIEWSRNFAGYPILVPTIDTVEIGSGGGSLAWVDGAVALRAGPESAGADPGPACYGRGGNRSTVTDANIVAGRINPDYFLGGEIPLNVCLAKKAIIPTDPAVFSAWDMLVTDLRQDFIKTFIVQTDQVELKK